MPQTRQVLVIDDDEDLRTLLVDLLERARYRVRCAGDGRAGLRQFHAGRPDLVVLDIGMPELDGFQTLERLRDLSDTPVLILTVHDSELERVRGLRAGADDYMGKPFGRQELLARVGALLRRPRSPRRDANSAYRDDLLEIDMASRSVTVSGEHVSLTPLELRLLWALVRHPDQVLSPGQLLEQAWGGATGRSSDQVTLYVSYLRRKLAERCDQPSPIETVRGFGYRYRPVRLIPDS